MKNLFLIATVTLSSFLSLGAFAREGEVHEKVIGVSDVYIPSGFDSSSETFVVVNGLFPHSCYKLKGVKVDHIGPALHEVTTLANVTEGLCLTVLIPFHKEVQMGKLVVGEHKIHFMNGDGTYMERGLTIEQ